MNRKPLREYLVGPSDDWDRLPQEFTMAGYEEWPYVGAWLRRDGIQFIASVKDYGALQVIHVTLAPVYTLAPERRREDLQEQIAQETASIIRDFFGDRQFARQPDDPRTPDSRHYFSPL